MIAWLKILVTKDPWLKLFSLALAVLVWFTVNSMANQRDVLPVRPRPLAHLEQRTFYNLPVLVVSSAEDNRNVHINPKTVQVTVEAEPNVLNGLQDHDIRVLVDLTGVEAAHDMRKRIEISTPAGVTRTRADPQEVQIVFPTNRPPVQ
jgi:hypothetical protein